MEKNTLKRNNLLSLCKIPVAKEYFAENIREQSENSAKK